MDIAEGKEAMQTHEKPKMNYSTKKRHNIYVPDKETVPERALRPKQLQ